jgi:hypothetical protein
MRLVAFNAVHMALNYRMMLWHSKFCFRLQMTLKTRRRIFAGVHNELPSPATRFHMLAPRPMTRFATSLALELCVFDVHTRMRARPKYPCDVRMTLRASSISDVSCSRNFRRRNYRPSQCRTGYCEEHNQEQCADSRPHRRNLCKSMSHFNTRSRQRERIPHLNHEPRTAAVSQTSRSIVRSHSDSRIVHAKVCSTFAHVLGP